MDDSTLERLGRATAGNRAASAPAAAGIPAARVGAACSCSRAAGGKYGRDPSCGGKRDVLLRPLVHGAIPLVRVVQRSTATCGATPRWFRPANGPARDVLRRRVAEPDVHARVVGRRVAAVAPRPPPEALPVAADNLDPRAEHVAGRCPCESQSDPMMAVGDLVDEQPSPAVVVGDEDVHVAVVVDVAEGRPAAHLRRCERGAGAIRHVGETPVGEIAEQLVALCVREGRAGVLADVLHRAVDCQHVEPPVVVEVEPGGSEAGLAEAGGAEPGRGASVREEGSPVVDVDRVRLTRQMGHEQILVAVVVEVAGVDAHARFGVAVRVHRRTRQWPGVGERAVAPVHPELILVAVVGDVDVEPSRRR